ncbi:hypothetical protein FB451DRAFT_1269072 [Mycena latifolia]|nr:hypothetical protein FB451DRAFT_1269072 [Mycena latifolia]
MSRAPRNPIIWYDLTVQELKTIFIDIIQGHNKYYISTGESLYGGALIARNLRCCRQGEQKGGILVDLDSLRPSDPLLLSTTPDIWTALRRAYPSSVPRGPEMQGERTVPQASHAVQYHSELAGLLFHMYLKVLVSEPNLRLSGKVEALFWDEPGPFRPQFLSMVRTWFRPLWRLAGDEMFFKGRRDRRHLTYEKVMEVIVRDVGPGELVFRAALRVPLPLPIPEELVVKPAFQCLIHIASVAELKRAVADIAKAMVHIGDASLCLPSLTPNRMLFQYRNLSATSPLGFILDLDPLDEPQSIVACAGVHHDLFATRFAAYDLISGSSTPPLHTLSPRHALESLFNCLVWFYACNKFRDSSKEPPGIAPLWRANYEGEWYDPRASMLSNDRTTGRYMYFLRGRRKFLWEWDSGFLDASSNERADDMCEVLYGWLQPLWKLIGEAHFLARWRESEDGYDWETLGGQFTAQKFMTILMPESGT